MRKTFFASICLFMGLYLFSSCAMLDRYALKVGYEKLSVAQATLQSAKQQAATDLAQGKQEVANAKDTYWKQVLGNFQNASNWNYQTWTAAQLNQKTYPSRLADLIFYRADSSLKFSLVPDLATIRDSNKVLMDELDTQKTSNQQLQDKYNTIAKTAQDAQDKLTQYQTVIKQKEDALKTTQTDDQQKIDAAQQKVDQANGKVITEQQKNLANAENEAQFKHTIIWVLMGMAVLFGLGAAYGPLNYKLESAVGTAACIGLAILVSYIQPWMIFTAFGAIIALLGLSYYIKHHKESLLNSSVIGAIQDVKTDANEVYNSTVKPKLQDWFKDHPELDKEVQAKLVNLNLINKNDAAATNGTAVASTTK